MYSRLGGSLRCALRLDSTVRRYSKAGVPDPHWAVAFTEGDIPRDQLSIKFMRSSGPGGQNVNKVSTKVELRFEVDSALWIPDFARAKLKDQEANRINKAGEFVLTSDKYRTQAENIEDAFGKLHEIVQKAGFVPRETSAETKAAIARNIAKGRAADRAFKERHKSKKSDRGGSWRD
ncbi:hypothetical protein DFJ74DRAFT_482550 [Hyaloraphidium curvatum]|nr:hypothetical protein DFJ74DRAFT_482550 [Hyaloraphidium curvatum]